MKSKIVILVVLLIVTIGLGVYMYLNTESDNTTDENTTVQTEPQTEGDLETLQSNESVADQIKQLSKGMSKDEVHTIMGVEPTDSGETTSDNYDNYESYEIDETRYDIYYSGDSLYGVSAVVK